LIGIKASITGDKEIDRLLRDLGQKSLKDADIKRGLKQIAKPLIKDIRGNINNVTGNLKKSIGVIKGIRGTKGKPFILVGARVYGNFKGFHAHLVEVGKENFDVDWTGRRFIEAAFNANKTQALSKVRDLMLKNLEKKLKKFK